MSSPSVETIASASPKGRNIQSDDQPLARCSSVIVSSIPASLRLASSRMRAPGPQERKQKRLPPPAGWSPSAADRPACQVAFQQGSDAAMPDKGDRHRRDRGCQAPPRPPIRCAPAHRWPVPSRESSRPDGRRTSLRPFRIPAAAGSRWPSGRSRACPRRSRLDTGWPPPAMSAVSIALVSSLETMRPSCLAQGRVAACRGRAAPDLRKSPFAEPATSGSILTCGWVM